MRDATLDVHVLGSGFDAGSRADFLLAGAPDPKVLTNRTRFDSSGDLVANITIAADAVPSYRDMAVTTSTGKKGIGTAKFQVLEPILSCDQRKRWPLYQIAIGWRARHADRSRDDNFPARFTTSDTSMVNTFQRTTEGAGRPAAPRSLIGTSAGHGKCVDVVIMESTTCRACRLKLSLEHTSAGRRFSACRSVNGKGTMTTSPGLKVRIRRVVIFGAPLGG